MEYKVAPSLLAADFTRLGEQVHEIEEAGAPYLHLDVMDGAFVPSISFGMPVLKSLRKVTNMTFDVHMMVEEPGRYIEDIKNAGADIITVHAEACTHLDRVVNQIKEAGCKAGVALNPATPVSVLECILGQVDMVLIMTVNPGFGGQAFIPEMMSKVERVVELREKGGYSFDIEVDGGVDNNTIAACAKAGANVFVAGSYLFKNPDLTAQVQTLRDAIDA